MEEESYSWQPGGKETGRGQELDPVFCSFITSQLSSDFETIYGLNN
jgi:hypothetical protein